MNINVGIIVEVMRFQNEKVVDKDESRMSDDCEEFVDEVVLITRISSELCQRKFGECIPNISSSTLSVIKDSSK